MKASLSVPLFPHDADYFGPLNLQTMVDVKIDEQAVQIFFNEDFKQDVKPTFARSVVVEFDKNDLVKVHVYPFDQEEPVTVKIGLDCEHLVEAP